MTRLVEWRTERLLAGTYIDIPLDAFYGESSSMDASPLFDPQYLPIIAATLIGFAALAAVLLVPIYRFLDREEEVAKEWTPEAVAERMREQQHGTTDGTEEPDRDEGSSPETKGASPDSTTS